MSALPTPVGTDPRRRVVWVVRGAVAAALFGGATWWGSTANFAGLTYCELHHVECVDDMGAESFAPFVLWPATAFVTVVVCLTAALTGPVAIRQRIAWAAMIGCSVFAANRNNVLWAFLITAVAVWGVASMTE